MEDLEVDVAKYPPLAQQLLQRFVTGAVSSLELRRWSSAASTLRVFGQQPLEG